MYKVMNILQNIKRRIKENMGAYYLTLGAIFVPFGFIALLEYENKIFAILAFVIGIVSIFFGSLTIRKDEKEGDKVEYNRWKLQTEILQEILNEMKRLRGVGNERNNDKSE